MSLGILDNRSRNLDNRRPNGGAIIYMARLWIPELVLDRRQRCAKNPRLEAGLPMARPPYRGITALAMRDYT